MCPDCGQDGGDTLGTGQGARVELCLHVAVLVEGQVVLGEGEGGWGELGDDIVADQC